MKRLYEGTFHQINDQRKKEVEMRREIKELDGLTTRRDRGENSTATTCYTATTNRLMKDRETSEN